MLLVAFVLVETRIASPMFDLSLFRLPTFSGGLVAAFGISASIFAMFLYLVLYLQDILGLSALQTGVRFLVISGAILVTSAIAGRLTSFVPVRLLIGPGLAVIGIGLLLMRGLERQLDVDPPVTGSDRRRRGVGLVNPPLASTAIGVVDPRRAGMASGINSTFRQVGIATGIALLGTLFSSRFTSEVTSQVAQVPSLAGNGSKIAAAVQSGGASQAFSSVPASARAQVRHITVSSFTTGLNYILLVAAIIAFTAGCRRFHDDSPEGLRLATAAAT